MIVAVLAIAAIGATGFMLLVVAVATVVMERGD